MYKFIIKIKISQWENSETPELTMEEMYVYMAAKSLYLDLNVLRYGLLNLAKNNNWTVDIYKKDAIAYNFMKKEAYKKVGILKVIKHQNPIIDA